MIARKIIKNSGIVLTADILKRVIAFVNTWMLARYLTKESFGIYSFALAFLIFFAILDNIWLKPILIREVVRNEEKAAAGVLLGNVALLKLFISFIAIALIGTVLWFMKIPFGITVLVYFALTNFIVSSFVTSYEVVFHAKLAMSFYEGIDLLINVILLLSTLLIIYLNGNLLLFISSIFTVNLIRLCLLRYFAERFIKLTFKPDIKLSMAILKKSWPLFVAGIFIIINMRIDQVILFKIKGPSSVGGYVVATKLVEYFAIIPLALSVSILPMMSAYFKTSKESFNKIYQLSYKYLLIMILYIVMIFTIFPKNIINFVYGEKYLSSYTILAILAWSQVFVFIGIVNKIVIISIDKLIPAVICTGIGAISNLILNIILIPKYDFLGAAIANFISYGVSAFLVCFIPSIKEYFLDIFRIMFKPLIASLIMGMFICLFSIPFLATLFITPLLYLFILYCIRGIGSNDFKLLRRIIFGLSA